MEIEIKKRMNFFILLNVILWILVFLLSNESYAQLTDDLHQKTIYEIANHTSSIQSPGITVGHEPAAIINYGNTIYVTNSGSNTVSVIDAKNNINIKNITVGDNPVDIAIPQYKNTIYVTNSGNKTISIIDGNKNTKIKDIKVGRNPLKNRN